jgi:hypothetical protein
MSSQTKMDMLLSFYPQHKTDILLLQEVTHEGFAARSGYTAHVNIGTDHRGTAILMRRPLSLERIDVLPSGRGLAGCYKATYVVNMYVPSGAARRAEREEFYHVHLPYLSWPIPQHFLLGGYFNYVMSKSDCTGEPNISKGLETFVRGFGAKDSWSDTRQHPTFTDYTSQGASRIDKLYLSPSLVPNKTAEILATAFTDHNAVIRLALLATHTRWGKGRCRLNITPLQDETRYRLRRQWEEWKTRIPKYRACLEWWATYVKVRIQRFFKEYGRESAREKRNKKNYYACIYDLLREPPGNAEVATRLKIIKAKICALQDTKTHRITIDYWEPELLQTERPTLYHLRRAQRRQQGRLITQIKDAAGMKGDTQEAIMSILTSSIAGGYDDFPVDDDCREVLRSRIEHKLTDQQQAQLDRPITEMELRQAILQGAVRKSPGADDIPLEFYRWGWEVIKTELLAVCNVMFYEVHITKKNRHGD